eukprot:COSAG01_NODE_8784_length_2660_cov_7.194846_6_plen_61_part_00
MRALLSGCHQYNILYYYVVHVCSQWCTLPYLHPSVTCVDVTRQVHHNKNNGASRSTRTRR